MIFLSENITDTNRLIWCYRIRRRIHKHVLFEHLYWLVVLTSSYKQTVSVVHKHGNDSVQYQRVQQVMLRIVILMFVDNLLKPCICQNGRTTSILCDYLFNVYSKSFSFPGRSFLNNGALSCIPAMIFSTTDVTLFVITRLIP